MAWVETESGLAIPEPALGSGGVTISTFVNAGRNAQGKFIGQRIGPDKMKIEMSWNVLENDQFRALLRLFDEDRSGKFVQDFVVYDPRESDYVTKRFYVGDRQGKPFKVHNPGVGHPEYWTEVQANLIEV